MPPSHARPELLASTDWLAENLGRPGVRIVDCRWRPDGSAADLFAAGHVAGATRLDWALDLVDPDDPIPLQLAGPDRIASAAARAGIGDVTVAVLYDDSAALYASRVWWCLRAYGFVSSRILDGGLGRWQAAGHSTAPGQLADAPATFTPRADLRARVTAAEVRATLGDRDVEIIDTRAPAEYRGQAGNALRLGHVPGAINVPAALLTVPGDGRFRPAEEILRLLGAASLGRGRRVIVYDGSGVGAAKLAFGLALVGFDDVAVYDGGWTEWGDRADLPVER